MFVTIDPGLATGWSIWNVSGLVACGLGDPRTCPKHVVTSDQAQTDVIHSMWIEMPVIYPKGKVPPNDVVTLAASAGRWAGRYDALAVDVHYVKPAEWKGQVPKQIHHPRIWAALSARDQGVVHDSLKGVAPSKRHNVLDAIGIGQWVRGLR